MNFAPILTSVDLWIFHKRPSINNVTLKSRWTFLPWRLNPPPLLWNHSPPQISTAIFSVVVKTLIFKKFVWFRLPSHKGLHNGCGTFTPQIDFFTTSLSQHVFLYLITFYKRASNSLLKVLADSSRILKKKKRFFFKIKPNFIVMYFFEFF